MKIQRKHHWFLCPEEYTFKHSLNVITQRSRSKVDSRTFYLILEYSELLELARQRNSRLMVARQKRMVADEAIKLARSAFYPFLSLGADYLYSDVTVSSQRADITDDIVTTRKDGSVFLRLSCIV